jgi:secreted Zn-dependent insulinase-like peptidase
VPEIWRHAFQYLALLRAPGAITQAIHDDNAALRRLAFDYRERPDSFSYTSDLAATLQLRPPEHLLHALYHVPLEYRCAIYICCSL